MNFYHKILMYMLTFISLTVIFPEMIFVKNFTIAFAASFVLWGLNMLVKPILILLSLPLTILTLGLFSFVINALILQWTAQIVGSYNFGFSSFGAAMLAAIIFSFVNLVVSQHFSSKKVKNLRN